MKKNNEGVVINLKENIKKDSLLGKIFELGYKVGFITCLIDNKINKYNHKIQSYKESVVKGNFGCISEIFEREILKVKPYAKKYSESLLNRVKNLGFDVDSECVQHLTAYSIGCWEGYIHCNQFIREKSFKDIHLIYFDINSEVPFKGYAENSDLLLYLEDNKGYLHLYLYDLKFMFGRVFVETFQSEPYIKHIKGNYTIPPILKGYPLAVSLGNNDFLSFVNSFISFIETKEAEELVLDVDLKNILQVLSYLMDYLVDSKNIDRLKTINFGIISGISDGLSYKFFLEENWYNSQEIQDLAEKVKDLYKKTVADVYSAAGKIKSKNIDNDTLLEYTLHRNIKKLEKEIESLKEEILKQDNKTYKVEISKDIDQIRKDVKKIVEDFWKKFINNSEEEKMVLGLLHSTGAGKTTASREIILGQTTQPVVYLYFAPRKKLVTQEFHRIKKSIPEERIIIHLPNTNKRTENGIKSKKLVKGASLTNQITKEKKGNIQDLIQQVNLTLNEQKEEKKHIVVLTTTQSITKNIHNKGTYEHIKNLVPSLQIHGYKCVIVIDELSGSDNGLFSLSKLLDFVKKYPDIFTILVFDANLHSKSIFQAVLKEFRENSYISPSILLSKFEKDGVINYDDVNIYVYSDYSFPAKEVILREKFFFENTQEKDAVLKEVVDYLFEEHLKKMKSQNQRMYVYIQDKEAVNIFQSLLTQKGIKAEYYTSNYHSGEKDSINQDSDVIISTSTLSRGIDLYNNFTKVCIINTHFFSPESNFGEELQACARIRGIIDESGKNIDRLITKEIIRVVIARESDDEMKQAITESLYTQIREDNPKITKIDKDKLNQYIDLWVKLQSLKDSLMYSYIGRHIFDSYFNPHRQSYVLVPVSGQRTPVYIPSQEIKLESIISFINDLLKVKEVKEDKNFEKSLNVILYNLKSLIDITSIKDINLEDIVYFYPPYCLMKHELISQLNEEMRENLVKILNDNFKEKLIKINPDKMSEIETFINELLSVSKIEFQSIIYIPLVAMLYEIADDRYRFEGLNVRAYLSRANIKTAFSYINDKRQFTVERIPGTESIKIVAFPVELQESFGWISGDYPKLSGEHLHEILKQKLGEHNGYNNKG